MEAAHARAAMTLVSPSSGAEPRLGAVPVAVRPHVSSSEIKLRVLIAERRASAHSELSRRLDRAGHEVLARVTSGQGALDYAELLRPDVVLIAPALDDGPGIMAAIALTRELPGVAAVVLSTHPAAVNPAARPNWGAVALLPADAEPADLDIELRRAVAQAREAAATAVVPEQLSGSQPRPADFAPVAAATPQYQTPVPDAVNAVVRDVKPGGPAVLQPIVPVATASAEPVTPGTDAKLLSGPVPSRGGRSPLSFTDEDLVAIGPIADPELPRLRPAAAQAPQNGSFRARASRSYLAGRPDSRCGGSHASRGGRTIRRRLGCHCGGGGVPPGAYGPLPVRCNAPHGARGGGHWSQAD